MSEAVTRIAIAGAGGRMGRRLVALAQEVPSLQVVAALEYEGSELLGKDAGEVAGVGKLDVPMTSSLDVEIDAMIDFSIAAATQGYIETCVKAEAAYVLGTTGLGEDIPGLLEKASATIPVLWAPNFSLVVNVLFHLSAQAAKMLGDSYDIEVLEAHHRFKKDAPSGTALKLAERICEATGKSMEEDVVYTRHGDDVLRKPGEITMQTLRIGDHPGEHTAYFAALGERLEIKHVSTSRDSYVTGALQATVWLADKGPGQYSMDQVLGLK